jgi:glycopeptide antibiotics resistance protein
MAKTLVVAYLALVLVLTLLPDFGVQRDEPVTVYLTPFRTVRNALAEGLLSSEFALVVGNIAMFAPLGVLVPMLRARTSWWQVLAAALGLSAGIELMQLTISLAVGHDYRTADVDDVMLNVAGSLLGYVAFRIWERRDSAVP